MEERDSTSKWRNLLGLRSKKAKSESSSRSATPAPTTQTMPPEPSSASTHPQPISQSANMAEKGSRSKVRDIFHSKKTKSESSTSSATAAPIAQVVPSGLLSASSPGHSSTPNIQDQTISAAKTVAEAARIGRHPERRKDTRKVWSLTQRITASRASTPTTPSQGHLKQPLDPKSPRGPSESHRGTTSRTSQVQR